MTPAPERRAGNQSITIDVRGKDVHLLDGEAGGHRIQRVPSTERNGRIHTSTVTVAVMDGGAKSDVHASMRRTDSDFRVEWYNGTVKAGGQHHQKNANCCRLTHLPTGTVATAQTRSRNDSRRSAEAVMTERLDRLSRESGASETNGIRRAQVGSGQRADKRRTYRFQHDHVVDHVTGRRAGTADVMVGRFDLLWS